MLEINQLYYYSFGLTAFEEKEIFNIGFFVSGQESFLVLEEIRRGDEGIQIFDWAKIYSIKILYKGKVGWLVASKQTMRNFFRVEE